MSAGAGAPKVRMSSAPKKVKKPYSRGKQSSYDAVQVRDVPAGPVTHYAGVGRGIGVL